MMKTRVKKRGIFALTKPKQREVFNIALTRMMLHWYNFMLPKHFSASATNIYKYAQRSAPYIRIAKKKNPNWIPNVLTGDMKRAVFSGKTIRTKTTGGQLIGTCSFQRGHATPKTPNVAQEITKTTKKEIDELIKVFHSEVAKEVAKLSEPEKGVDNTKAA